MGTEQKTIPKPLGLSDDMNAFTIETGAEKPRSIDNYFLREITKIGKSHDQLLDYVQETDKKLTMIQEALKQLHDSEADTSKVEADRLSEQSVELTLSSNQIKASAIMALGAVIERPISNFMHNTYTPISTGAFGTLVGLGLTGLTYKRKSDWMKWTSQGYLIGGISQLTQDLFTWLSTQPGLGALGVVNQ